MKANRFRFRVWCKNHKEWEKHDCFLSQDGQLNQFCNGRLLPPMRQDTHIVCMSTDLCDKNGKEIFEGDIVQCGAGEPDAGPKEKVAWLDRYAGFVLVTIDFDTVIDHEQFSKQCAGVVSVIGNIYENPELLAKEAR